MKTRDESDKAVRVAIVGDLLLTTYPLGERPSRDVEAALSGMRGVFQGQDIVLANLECTLTGDGDTVATQPRVVATAQMVRSVQQAGVNLVTLANNHAFDCRAEGFRRLRRLLEELQLPCFGAGLNLAEAMEPQVITVKGVRLGFVTACDPRTGTKDVAGAERFGIAPLEVDSLCERVQRLKEQVHHVVVTLHWGEERFTLPSPGQVEVGRRLVDAGAALIVGHHPHIMQGMEVYKGAPIYYSLGNFLSSEVYYTDGDTISWNRREQTGCVVLAEFDAERLVAFEQRLTYDDGERVVIDESGFGRRWMARLNSSLAKGVSAGRYRQEQFRVNTLRPIVNHLRWSQLKHLRPRHFRNALAGFWRSLKK